MCPPVTRGLARRRGRLGILCSKKRDKRTIASARGSHRKPNDGCGKLDDIKFVICAYEIIFLGRILESGFTKN